MSVSSSQSPDSWIASFCSIMGHEYFAEVSEEFIEDDFNLTGLQSQVPMYKDALEMILDVEPSETNSSALSEEEEEEEEEEEDDGILGDELDQQDANGGQKNGTQQASRRSSRHNRTPTDTDLIEQSAELLYGLIHARYITSRPGIQQMLEKYELAHFGHCPRVYCAQARVLPVGISDTPGLQTVKLFCPSCNDVYTPPNSRFQTVDGAYFGTTFGCLFFMTFGDLEVGGLFNRKAREQERNRQMAAQSGQPVPPPTADDDQSTVFSPTEMSGTTFQGTTTASRSSSLTLPGPPPAAVLAAQAQRQKEIDDAARAAAAKIPPQPQVINGMATNNLAPGLGKGRIYEPKIYGFRVSERAKTGPRMQWLRMRPADVNELDEAALYEAQNGPEMSTEIDGDQEDVEMTSQKTGEVVTEKTANNKPRRRKRKSAGAGTTAG